MLFDETDRNDLVILEEYNDPMRAGAIISAWYILDVVVFAVLFHVEGSNERVELRCDTITRIGPGVIREFHHGIIIVAVTIRLANRDRATGNLQASAERERVVCHREAKEMCEDGSK